MDIKELQAVCDKMVELREALAELETHKKELNGELTELKKQTVEHLENHGLKNFDYGGGKVSITERRSVKMVDKYEFFEWLKNQGTFEDIVSVNAQTLKKIYTDEYEAAVERGDVEFISNGLPGVSEPSVHRDIRFLK